MNRFFVFLVSLPFAAPLLAQTTRPVPGIDHVLIISVDGLRPDVLLRADTPNMHTLFHNGSFTFWARTTAQSITLPSHVSMLTGVVPEKNVTCPVGPAPRPTLEMTAPNCTELR